MSSYKELLAQREKLDNQIQALMLREKAEGITKAKSIIQQYDLSVADVFGSKASKGKRGRPAKSLGKKGRPSKKAGLGRGKSGPRGKVAAKYLNPSTGEKWTGRGIAPKWIAGKDRNKFLIK
ncbi:MAG: H-NS histone family protein [Polynucleobacter sp.]|jgi:DNA-binding protein H-NS|nr:H-NS histone family protein [Polynucleobacter sp.]